MRVKQYKSIKTLQQKKCYFLNLYEVKLSHIYKLNTI